MPRKSTKDLILSVAAKLFATTGFRRTTMETIAAAAGRGRRTLYMYFQNKAEIYNAVVDKEISMITAPLKDVVASEGSPEDILLRYAIVRLECLTALLKRNPLLLKDFSQGHNRIERLREKLNDEEKKILFRFFSRFLDQSGSNLLYKAEALVLTFLNMLRGNDRLLTVDGNIERANDLSVFGVRMIITYINNAPEET